MLDENNLAKLFQRFYMFPGNLLLLLFDSCCRKLTMICVWIMVVLYFGNRDRF